MAAIDDDEFLDEEPADICISFPPEVQNAIEQVRKMMSTARRSSDGLCMVHHDRT